MLCNFYLKKEKEREPVEKAGFTLIEMAIVLVIIGLIVGAIMKGRDLIKSAQIKNAYETFFAAHYKLLGSYYDRTGQLLGDGIVNGGRWGQPNGYMDNVWLSGSTNRQNILTALRKAGIDPCTLIKSNLTSTECGTNGVNFGQIRLAGEYYTSTVWVGQYYARFSDGYKNGLWIHYLPVDYAVALDKMIDGVVNCAAGSFRVAPNYGTCTDGQWPDPSQTSWVGAFWIVDF